MIDLSRFCCLNSGCPDHGERSTGDLTVTSRYGPGQTRPMLRRRNCKEPHRELADPADVLTRDCRDHMAPDPEHRLVPGVVPGRRLTGSLRAIVTDARRRTGGRAMPLVTTDEYPAYEGALPRAYGETVTPPRTGRRGRPKAPYGLPAAGLKYAAVVKTRKKAHVVEADSRVVFGSEAAVRVGLMASPMSRAINTAFVERHDGTDGHHYASKAREADRFSKAWHDHETATSFARYSGGRGRQPGPPARQIMSGRSPTG